VRPVICLITDRRRLARPDEDGLVAQVAEAVRAGVDLVQVRERDLEGATLLRLVRRCVDEVRASSTRILVNDRVDVALAAGAHGVHLRGDSLPAARIRDIAPPGFLVGRSVHDEAEVHHVTRGGGVDYLVFGAVFETTSKPDRSPAGVDRLRAVVNITPVPVLAIGGMTSTRLSAVAATGAAGFAAIGLFTDTSGSFRGIVDDAATAFAAPRRLG
jgi:thiamine-phosphate diphosphorylase